MKRFPSLLEAIDDLKSRGFSADFNLKADHLECAATQLKLHPDEFEIVEFYRFEGSTNPSDSSVVYAIAGKHGLNGILVDAYGVYANPVSTDLLAKLHIHHEG